MNKITARERLFELHQSLCDKAFKVMIKKNEDYASIDNPYSNFQMSEAITGVQPECGIMLRIGDKLARIKTFLTTGNLNNESLEDSIIDIINYLILMKGMLNEELVTLSNHLKDDNYIAIEDGKNYRYVRKQYLDEDEVIEQLKDTFFAEDKGLDKQ